jgi:O-acetylhomoserine (thiol)-lyase
MLKAEIQSKAKDYGANLIGFADICRWQEYQEMQSQFYPQNIWDWSKTVIVLGIPIFLPIIETTPSVIYSELYNTTNRILDEMAYKIANFLNVKGYKAIFLPRDGYGEISDLIRKPKAAFSQVFAAKYAGLGTIGFNHTLLTPQYGPRVRFVSVITNAQIDADKPLTTELCTKCGLCKKNCPISAFSENPNSLIGDMDQYRCAAYHKFLKEEHRYPCGVCIMMCPSGHDRQIYGNKSVSNDGIKHCQEYGSAKDADNFRIAKRRFIMSNTNYKFETLQIHVGQEKPDPATDARAVPIYQTSSYVFKDAAQAAGRFALTETGNIYTRIMNPTWDVLEKRIAALEKGVAALATASGAAATAYAIQNIARSGDHIVSDNAIYGGTYNYLAHTIEDSGITATFVDGDNPQNFEKAIQANTKAIFLETLGNPNSTIIDLEAVSNIAHKHGIPLIVDNTFATPFLLRPIEYGADIVVHSATKFIGGHGTTIGGLIIDSGNFDWAQNDKFPGLSKPNPSYHGIVFTEAVGNLAYIIKARTTLLRDTGAALSPFNAFLLLQGLETLSLRVERHVFNTLKVVEFLSNHPQVEKVNHPSLKDHRDHALYKRYFSKYGGGVIFTFEIKGDDVKAKRFIDNLKLFSLLANVADVKSLVIHPASTTHSQLSKEELLASSIKPSTIRLSIGTEHIDDIIADLTNAFEAIK